MDCRGARGNPCAPALSAYAVFVAGDVEPFDFFEFGFTGVASP